MTAKRQPVDYAAQVAARRAAALAAGETQTTEAAPTTPQGGGAAPTPVNGETSHGAGAPAEGQITPPIAGTPSDTQQTVTDKDTKPKPEAKPPERPIGVSAVTPLPKKKADRQGIDLRPIDRERWERFEMFCLKHRLRLGKKKGLSLYARAGLQLLDELVARDEAAAEALLRSIGESERRETA